MKYSDDQSVATPLIIILRASVAMVSEQHTTYHVDVDLSHRYLGNAVIKFQCYVIVVSSDNTVEEGRGPRSYSELGPMY